MSVKVIIKKNINNMKIVEAKVDDTMQALSERRSLREKEFAIYHCGGYPTDKIGATKAYIV